MIRGNSGSGMVKATWSRRTFAKRKVSKQITEKVQDQGEKYDVFDFAHDGFPHDGESRVVADFGTRTFTSGRRQGAYRHIDCRSLTDLTNMHSSTLRHNYLPMLCFNPRHWHVVALCAFEFLILRGLSQATLELRACVCFGYLP